ncbi:MAG: GNAT family acetyltransferase [Henriciella sp.]|nr:GNAT family acetyltransferase [Henriciella sp.]
MNTKADIRAFRPGDEDGVIALWNEVFLDEGPWNKPQDVISRKLSVQPELFYVATRDTQIIGTIIAGYDGVRGWVHKLAVRPDHRRQGLASALMHHAEKSLKDIGCPKLNLQVRASNLGMLKFYESLGYAVEDRASLGKPLV